MIDWYSVGFGTLWIIGLGFVVSVLSYANYKAIHLNRRFLQVLEMLSCRIMIDLGLVFICLGLTGSVSGTLERILWAVLGLIFSVRICQLRKMSNP